MPRTKANKHNSVTLEASDLLEGLNKAFAALLKIQDFDRALFTAFSIVADATGSDGISFSEGVEITPAGTLILPQRMVLHKTNGMWQRLPPRSFEYDVTKSPLKEWMKLIRSGRPIQGSIRQFDDFLLTKLGGAAIRDHFLAVLVADEEQQMGILTLGSDQPGKIWQDAEVQMVRSFAFALGSYTARRKAEESLRAKRDYFRKILDLNPNLIFAKDRSGRYTMANLAIADIYGVEVKSLIGKTDRDFNPHSEEIERFLANNEEVFQSATPRFIDHYTLTDPAGRLHHAQASKLPIMNAEGEVEEVLVVITDITRQKEAEDNIREKEQLNRTILDTIPDILLVVEMDTQRYTYLNIDRRKEVFGYPVPEIKGHFDFFDLIMHPKAKAGLPAFLDRLRNASDTHIVEAEYQVRHADGEYIWLHERAKAFRRDASGKVLEYIAFIQDITPLRKNVIELDEKNRQLQRYIESNMQLENFAYIASHDLREPLRTIRNFSQLLLLRHADALDTNGREYLNFVTDSAGRLNDLIEDLLVFSTVTATESNRQYIVVREIIDKVKQGLTAVIEKHGAVIQEEDLPEGIYGNPYKLQQLLQNLISNAVKFHRPGVPPRLTISGTEHATHWHFRVSDNGIGIPEEHFERIFLLFKRLHSRDKYEGTGLGLAIAKKVAEQHGGEIGVESTPGQGSAFWFTLRKP